MELDNLKTAIEQSKLSPSYLTSKSSLLFLAKSKQKEAITLSQYLQIDLSEDMSEKFNSAICMEEFIYLATNALIKKAGNPNVLEFPCGYSPRGMKLSEEGYSYVGGDSSIIAQTMGLARMKMVEDGIFSEQANCHYTNLSLTNYASLEYAASMFEGPITIVTQGLMSWLPMDKKLLVIDNIRTLLESHGGCLIMADSDSKQLTSQIYHIIKNRKEEMGQETESAPRYSKADPAKLAKAAKLKLDTVNWTGSVDLVESMKKLGFTAQIVQYPDKLPYLNSLDLFADGKTRVRIANVMKAYNMTVYAADPDYKEEMDPDQIDFSVYMAIFGTTLQVTICGNLTTATAPILLDKFEQYNAEGGFNEIDVDFSYVPMIDPAGLRALLVMKKAIGDKIMRYGDMNESVAEVMNATGFGDVLD